MELLGDMGLVELLGDVDLVESRFGPFGDSVSVSARLVHGLCQTNHGLRYHLGRTGWYSSVTKLNFKLIFVHLEIVLIWTQDQCTVCAECTIGSEIILDAPDGTSR